MTNWLKLLMWTPRVLGILMVLFLAAFALDVFDEPLGFWSTVGAFAIHLVPSAIAAIALAVAWRWSAAGGLLFILAGVAYAVMARDHLSWILVISGPLWLIGGLFAMSSLWSTGATAAARS